MSEAAKHLYISQPTISQSISEIEKFYNVKLFERLSKKLYITHAGEILLDYASRIVTLYNEMEGAMKSNKAKRIRLGATLTVGSCIFSEIVTMYHQICPEIETHVVVKNTKEIERGLLAGELDIALVEGHIDNPEIIYEPVISDTLVLISSANHPLLSDKSSVKMQYLHQKPLVLREKGSGTRESFEQHMLQSGCDVNCVWVCHDIDAIKNAVIAGHGLTVISHRLVQREIESGLVHACRIEDYQGKRMFALTYHKDKHIFPYITNFMELCRNFESE